MRRRSLRSWLAGALGVAAAGGAVGVGMNAWVLLAARGLVFEDVATVPARRVAIVLGARVYPDGTPSWALRDRLEAGLRLYEAGRVTRILVSGDHGNPEYDEVKAMGRWLVVRGVPAEDVFLDHAGFRTLDTMQRAYRVFRVRDAVVCTQRFHLPRSIFLARDAGIDAVGLVADQRAYDSRWVDQVREFVARSIAVVDTQLLGTGPKLLGETIDIRGDGRVTQDG